MLLWRADSLPARRKRRYLRLQPSVAHGLRLPNLPEYTLLLNFHPLTIGLPGFSWTPLAVVAIPLLALFVVWMINLYNFMDGMDGFAGGMAAIGFATLALLAHAADHAEQRRQQMEMQQHHLSELEKARAEVDAAQLRAENAREQQVAALQELDQQHVLLVDAQQALAQVKRDADARALNEQRLRLVLEVLSSVSPYHVLC